MNSLNVFDVGTEVGSVIDLVLEQDASDFVGHELWWLHGIVALEKEIVLQASGMNGELQISAGFDVRVSDNLSPHLDGVGAECILRR